jgi:hypothetical protein
MKELTRLQGNISVGQGDRHDRRPSGANVDDSDIVCFVPSSLGATTAGAFVFHFDGSDVGLTTDDEDVDAIALS